MNRLATPSLAALALLLAACPKSIKEGAANVLLPPSEEEQLGDRMAADLAKKLRFVKDPEVNAYVDAIGKKIVAAVPPNERKKGIKYDFHVVDDKKTVNAFAIPGGHIYVYSGLLLEAENEAEVAAVMGHEVAHVTARHIAERMVEAMGLQLVLDLALGGNASQLAQIAGAVAANGYLLKHSRDDELEADRLGVNYSSRGGWDPDGAVTFFQKLRKEQGRDPAAVEVWLSSHPPPADRIERLKAAIAKLPKKGTETDAATHGQIEARLK